MTPRVAVREFDAARDAGAVRLIDTTAESAEAYVVVERGERLGIEAVALAAPVTKRFSLPEEPVPGQAYVAVVDERVVGFASWHLEAWNRRAVLDHWYVDARARRRGAGRALVDCIANAARAAGAVTLWAETPGADVPAVAAYRRLGFELCGFDRSLYAGTPADGEVALFLARPFLVDG